MMSEIMVFVAMFLGAYEPIKYSVTVDNPVYDPTLGAVVNTSSTYDVIPSGMAGVNFEYIAGMLILAICLYFVINSLRFFINVSLGKKI
jgi:hypothetical protein